VDTADTSSEVRRRQIGAYRAMSPDDRLALAFELSESMRTITTDGIRARHPGLDERGVAQELIRIWHGDDLLMLTGGSSHGPGVATG